MTLGDVGDDDHVRPLRFPIRLHHAFERLSLRERGELSDRIAYALPVTVAAMNYNSVILVGIVFLITVWWIVHGWKRYPGPKLAALYTTVEGVEPMGTQDGLS